MMQLFSSVVIFLEDKLHIGHVAKVMTSLG